MGCDISFGIEQPAYVNPSATSQGGKCLVSSKVQLSTCSSSHIDTMRLCPCM